MSMIYECPTCHAPQAAGRTACLECGAEFDGAVPDDAILPETPAALVPAPSNSEPADINQAVEGEEAPPVAEAVLPPIAPEPERMPPPPRLEAVTPPPPVAPLPSQAPPYQPLPYQPPPMYPTTQPLSMQKMGGGGPLPKALLIAIPVILVLVLVVVFFTQNLDKGSAITPVPSLDTTPAATPPPPSSAPPGNPLLLPGNTSSGSGGDATTKWLVGRWQAKTTDFYVFNSDNSGFRGSVTGKQPKATFQWALVQNQLILYADKQEKLIFSPGPDDGTMFLRGEDGKYVEYARTKTDA